MKTTTTERPHYEANTQKEAWAIANKLFPGDYEYDAATSSRAGYPQYFSTNPATPNAHINDLNARLEVCLENGDCINIWFSDLYWKAIENESLKKEIAKKDAEIADLKQRNNEGSAAFLALMENYKMQMAEIEALKAQISEMKANGYSLIDDLIA